jgi:HK97 family phage major capsid protein
MATRDSALSLGAAQEVHGTVLERLSALSDRCSAENRDPTPAEAREMRQLGDRLDTLKARITALKRSATLGPDAFTAKRGDGGAGSSTSSGRVRISSEPLTYEPEAPHSFFKDMYEATRFGDQAAQARLQRHREEMRVEMRDLSSTDGVGGDFIPPVHLAETWVSVARPSRPFANICTNRNLPQTGDVLNVPKVLTGAATSAHADLGAVQDVDPTTGVTSVPVKTIAGQVDVSQQALDRSAPGLDEVLFQDLVADYNMRLDLQILTGSGSGANAKGVLSDSNRIIETWTQATPTVALFYNQVASARSSIATQRYVSPRYIVMHPRRWAWLSAASDTTGRPLIVPAGGQFNSPGTVSENAAEGVVGTLQGLTVVLDANLPTNLGAGTNQDIVILTTGSDNYLWERRGGPVMRVHEQVLDLNLAVRIQVYNYFAFSSELRPRSNATVEGTGLVTPVFAD